MKFASPLWFAALAVIAARIALVVIDRKRREGAFRFSSLAILDLARTVRVRTSWLPFALEVAGLVLLVVALARPQHVERMNEDRRGIDIVVALDASGSMAAEDFQPRNRFEVAKELIGRFISQRESDRIGIVTFGHRAATRVPVTFDRAIAREVLSRAEVGENGDGTAIGTAIATAVNRLRTSPARSRVIVLLTDGVNNAGSIEPATAADIARQLGIRLYAIGVGSYGPVPVPIRMQNRVTGQIETVYQNIRADLDDEMLRGIARATGGEYFRATDERALKEILATIDTLEKSRLAAPPDLVVEELYRPPLLAGLLLLALALVSGETLWMRLTA
ncbi:MAG TPA: VWA domain-containing protein [Thermoanaerobaculia bacterium]|nr:VWA domain-containing protein [Thermoanaerobaculia bacterium]